jgi:hypothetical protein
MSKKGKVVIAIVAALVVVMVGAGWYVASRGWTLGTLAQRWGVARQLEVRLIDDNKDGAPDRGVVDLPAGLAFGRGFERGAGRGARAGQLEVRLVDDNGDGVPDRGVIDLSPREAFNPDLGPGYGRPFGRNFELARGRPFGLLLVPFFLLGGLIGLAGLALLISLTIFFYRPWQPTPPVAPVSASPAPAEVQPTPVETRLEPPAAGESTHEG